MLPGWKCPSPWRVLIPPKGMVDKEEQENEMSFATGM
jgi:hypothetical protein